MAGGKVTTWLLPLGAIRQGEKVLLVNMIVLNISDYNKNWVTGVGCDSHPCEEAGKQLDKTITTLLPPKSLKKIKTFSYSLKLSTYSIAIFKSYPSLN